MSPGCEGQGPAMILMCRVGDMQGGRLCSQLEGHHHSRVWTMQPPPEDPREVAAPEPQQLKPSPGPGDPGSPPTFLSNPNSGGGERNHRRRENSKEDMERGKAEKRQRQGNHPKLGERAEGQGVGRRRLPCWGSCRGVPGRWANHRPRRCGRPLSLLSRTHAQPGRTWQGRHRGQSGRVHTVFPELRLTSSQRKLVCQSEQLPPSSLLS